MSACATGLSKSTHLAINPGSTCGSVCNLLDYLLAALTVLSLTKMKSASEMQETTFKMSNHQRKYVTKYLVDSNATHSKASLILIENLAVIFLLHLKLGKNSKE